MIEIQQRNAEADKKSDQDDRTDEAGHDPGSGADPKRWIFMIKT